MSLGWAVIRHNKASNTLVLGFTNLVNSQVSKTLQHFDVLGICISISVHLNKAWGCVCVHIGVGFGVACSDTMAIPEPVKRNSNSAVPLFCMCTTSGTLLADYRFFVCRTKSGTLLADELHAFCVYIVFIYSYGWITHGFLRDPRHIP